MVVQKPLDVIEFQLWAAGWLEPKGSGASAAAANRSHAAILASSRPATAAAAIATGISDAGSVARSGLA
jgi:hypothetical protein